MTDVITDLEMVLLDRRKNPVADSYTTSLLGAGVDEIVKKIGEEAIEVIIAAKGQGDKRVVEESADLVYHLLVLLVARDLSWRDVQLELARRSKPGN